MKNNKHWDECPQIPIKTKDYNKAVFTAKHISLALQCEVRLSTSIGYNNQGTYIKVRSINEL